MYRRLVNMQVHRCGKPWTISLSNNPVLHLALLLLLIIVICLDYTWMRYHEQHPLKGHIISPQSASIGIINMSQI
uniref:Uncharacterized protein n=1 Tax=Arundo donax TaxID=35708 RepID=A0A0A8XS11_ARUDO